MLQIGSFVDKKYKVLSKIGQGGMSVVYLALNERANKTWAIKEIRKDGVRDFAAVKYRLSAETHILKSLNHRYLPGIADIIETDDSFLIVMDYIQGKPLNQVLRTRMEEEGKPLRVEEVISWGKQLSEVLYYLHTRSSPIIYRDMKPANIMLKPDGDISLIDFGTARVFKSGVSEDTICLGTPGYAAPEQYGGNGQSGIQTDIYCLGATLHHLVTGRNPAPTPFSFPPITQCRPVLMEETPREWRDALLGLETVIGKCTQYEIADRYQTCARLQYDLEHIRELGAPYRKKLKRRLAVFCCSAVVTAAFGGLSLFGLLMEHHVKINGYDYYIQQAVTGTYLKKTDNYRKAIALNPMKKEAYLRLLETLLEDNEFSAEEDQLLISILNSRDNKRKQENIAYLRTNESGFIEFAYQLGVIYYYADGTGRDKSAAKGWFACVSEADMDKLDMKENNSKKNAWKVRAKILGKISEYSGKIGVINRAGDAEVTYRDYWADMMALLDGTEGQDNPVTELRLYGEIAYQIFNRAENFKTEAGLSKKEMTCVLEDLRSRSTKIEAGQNLQIKELKQKIAAAIEDAQKQLAAVFADDFYRKLPDQEGSRRDGSAEF